MTSIDYRNKLILAPMVRVGTLPARLLSLKYGADLVYTEETIDFKVLKSQRKVNDILGTVDFVQPDGTVVFRTCKEEEGKVVFQMGTSNTQRALKVAKMLENDVAAIDINMGCPKEFSLKGGMGYALLEQTEKVRDMLTTLSKNLSIPVTCKIRIKPDMEETLNLVKMIEGTGVAAFGVHGRYKEERPRHPNHNDVIKKISEMVSIPVIANGGSKEIKKYEDIEIFKKNTGCSSVMLARAAMWNFSIFRPEGLLSTEQVVKEYLKYAVDFDNGELNSKYCVQQIMHEILDTPLGQSLQHSGSLREICDLFGMATYYDQQIAMHRKKEMELQRLAEEEGFSVKRRKLDDGSELTEMPLKFNKNLYNIARSPKTILYEWAVKKKLPNPKYENTFFPKERRYLTVVTVNGKKYGSSLLDHSKKWGEQAAAVVCLRILGIDEERKFVDGKTDPDLHPLDNEASVQYDTHNDCEASKDLKDDVEEKFNSDTQENEVSLFKS